LGDKEKIMYIIKESARYKRGIGDAEQASKEANYNPNKRLSIKSTGSIEEE